MQPASAARRGFRIVWAIIALCTAAAVAAGAVAGVGVDLASAALFAFPNAVMVGLAYLLARRGWVRLSHGITATAQLALISTVSMVLSVLLARTNLPLQDASLAALDRALGLDWRQLIDWFMLRPALVGVLNYAYASLHYQLALVPWILVLSGHAERSAAFVLAWSIALVATVAVFPFLPALGGYLHFDVTTADVPLVRVLASWLYADLFYAARSGAIDTIDLASLDGIVTFPSFHAAVAVLFAWCFWNVALLRWPVIAWNALMWISTVPIGAHYVVDVLAGSLVALAAILASSALMRGMVGTGATPALQPAGAQAGLK